MTLKIVDVESKSLHKHTNSNVLQSIDDFYIKEATNYLNKVHFGINIKKKTPLLKYRFLKAFDNIICRNMHCDLEVTDALLEAVSLYTKTTKFKINE